MLTAPDPTLAYEALAPGVAAGELPLTVLVGAVTRDGGPLGPQDFTAADLHTYRLRAPAAGFEVWEPATGTWVPDPGVIMTPGEPLMYLPGMPLPWQAIVVAGGQPRFEKASGGFPRYSFRARFDTAHEEVVTESPSVAFGSVLDRNLMVLGPGEGEQPDSATQARLQLKSDPVSVIGGLVIRRESGTARVRLDNSAGASIILNADGSIDITPAAGKPVLVNGDLETGRLVYTDASGTRKQAN